MKEPRISDEEVNRVLSKEIYNSTGLREWALDLRDARMLTDSVDGALNALLAARKERDALFNECVSRRTHGEELEEQLKLAKTTLEGVRVTVECRYTNEMEYVGAMVRIGIVVNKVLEHI